MKICFPVESDQGMDSVVYGHFGSAPFFAVFDTAARTVETIVNRDLGHVHGMCNPLKALDGPAVDAIVVGGIGAGAVMKLNTMGIKVYRAACGTVADNIGLFGAGELPEMSLSHACGGHGHAGGCGH